MSFIEGGMDTSRNIGRWKLRQARENMSLHKLELPTFTIYISSTFLPICFSGLIGGFSLLCRWFAWRNNSCLYLGRSCREKGEALCHCHCHFLYNNRAYWVVTRSTLRPSRYDKDDAPSDRGSPFLEFWDRSSPTRALFFIPTLSFNSLRSVNPSSKPAICFLLISLRASSYANRKKPVTRSQEASRIWAR